jgi:hypothetical protein
MAAQDLKVKQRLWPRCKMKEINHEKNEEPSMGWASKYIEQVLEGKTVQFRPRGNSMTGKINGGQLVTVEPVGDRRLQIGDIVLCKVNGAQYLHLIKAVSGERYQIGNNKGRINGWTSKKNVFGVVVAVSN